MCVDLLRVSANSDPIDSRADSIPDRLIAGLLTPKQWHREFSRSVLRISCECICPLETLLLCHSIALILVGARPLLEAAYLRRADWDRRLWLLTTFQNARSSA